MIVKKPFKKSIINLGSSHEISILKLAKLISSVIGYKVNFVFDKQKPNGTPRKVLDISLSIIEIMATLYDEILNINLQNPVDRFILSKGHGFLGLLSALHCKGFIKKEELLKFQTDGSELIAHPIVNSKFGIESSNVSLGQGLSFGVGLALSYKKKKKNGNIFVLIGDGECYEGAIWEAAISATESNLNNSPKLLITTL